jgi:hypothetical protein
LLASDNIFNPFKKEFKTIQVSKEKQIQNLKTFDEMKLDLKVEKN